MEILRRWRIPEFNKEQEHKERQSRHDWVDATTRIKDQSLFAFIIITVIILLLFGTFVVLWIKEAILSFQGVVFMIIIAFLYKLSKLVTFF